MVNRNGACRKNLQVPFCSFLRGGDFEGFAVAATDAGGSFCNMRMF
jgi:hypothetical protein